MNNWSKEIAEKGAYAAILDRMKFHGGLFVEDIQFNTGLCRNTVIKHLTKMVKYDGIINDYGDYFKYRPNIKPSSD